MKYCMINESVSITEIKSQPFFQRFPTLRLYRGMKCFIDGIVFMDFKFREKPRDSNLKIHDAVNKASNDKFGLPIRNLMFAYFDATGTTVYGTPYMIVPKGEYTLYAHPDIYDMTNEFLQMNINDLAIKSTVFKEALNTLMTIDFNHMFNIDYDFNQLFKDVMSQDSLLKRYSPSNLIITLVDDTDIPFNEEGDFMDLELEIRKAVSGVMMKELEKKSSDYVDGVIKFNSENEVEWDNAEIMVYAPNGFFVIHRDHFDDFT